MNYTYILSEKILYSQEFYSQDTQFPIKNQMSITYEDQFPRLHFVLFLAPLI
jgi:hypothetical protein